MQPYTNIVILSMFLGLSACGTLSSKSSSQQAVDDAETLRQVQVGEDPGAVSCSDDDSCDDPTQEELAQSYGGIEKQYTVKGCQVTIYNDGPVQMINEKTRKPCNAPIPKDHKYSKNTRTYQRNGCTITEYISADGIGDATMVCPEGKNKVLPH